MSHGASLSKAVIAAALAMALIGGLYVLTSGNAAEAGLAKCRGATATIVGTAGADELDGTAGRDVIVGRGGNDDIEGKRGNDLICGGGGNDDIEGDAGKDRIFGGRGSDDLEGDRGDDFLHGGRGNDEGDGGAGNDVCRKIEDQESC